MRAMAGTIGRKEIGKAQRSLRYMASLLPSIPATATALAILFGTAPSLANDTINNMIGAEDIGTGHSSSGRRPPANVPPGTESGAENGSGTGASNPTDGASPATATPAERWIDGGGPVDSLSVITVHPLPGDTCRNVLFDIMPSKRVRHEPRVGETMDLDLGELCLFGVRNDSDHRTLAIRLGEELRTVSIVSDSRLQSGMAIGPGHEVLTPIRNLGLQSISFDVELVWDDLIDTGKAEVDAFEVRLTHQPASGS